VNFGGGRRGGDRGIYLELPGGICSVPCYNTRIKEIGSYNRRSREIDVGQLARTPQITSTAVNSENGDPMVNFLRF
jgi:hypothetical protein